MIMRSFPCSRSTQGGMALIVSLVFLLLMTLIGISSMQNATLQEKMAGSVKFRNESFQAAEAAMRVGEGAVAMAGYVLAKCATTPTDVKCLPPIDSGTVLTNGNGANGVLWVATTNGLYGVQLIYTLSGNSVVNSPCTGASATLYRITGVGFSGPSRSVLESIYAKC
jgi:type IV pilus assembly protein PilX